MKFKFDVSDITRNIKVDDVLTKKQVTELTAKTTLDAHRELVLATPVDTGQARQGWEATTPTEEGQVGIVENNVEHIVYLNDGHSKQAPTGFVEAIVDKFNRGDLK